MGIGAQGVPAAQAVYGENAAHRILRDTVLQMLCVDGKIPQQGLFDVGVCGFCGGLDGEAGQHHGCHDQQKRQKRDRLALFPYGIQAGPFP